MRKNKGLALIIVLIFLFISSSIAIISIISLQNQQAITHTLLQLDEIRYFNELGYRRSLWIWRNKFGDINYFKVQAGCSLKPCYILEMDTLPSQAVDKIVIRVEDINGNRKIDSGDILVQVVEKNQGF